MNGIKKGGQRHVNLFESCGGENEVSQGVEVRAALEDDRGSVSFDFRILQPQFSQGIADGQKLPLVLRVPHSLVKGFLEVKEVR